MSKKSNQVRDAFTFGLLGLATKASFVAVPVVADDRLDRAREERNRKREAQSTDQQPTEPASNDEASTDQASTDQDRAA